MTLGWAFLLPNLLRAPGDVEHHVRLNDDSKIEAPNAEDLCRVFGLSIPEKFENRWKNKLGSVALG
jgi:hypothetical protein